jgi:hypothetical protein
MAEEYKKKYPDAQAEIEKRDRKIVKLEADS